MAYWKNTRLNNLILMIVLPLIGAITLSPFSRPPFSQTKGLNYIIHKIPYRSNKIENTTTFLKQKHSVGSICCPSYGISPQNIVIITQVLKQDIYTQPEINI